MKEDKRDLVVAAFAALAVGFVAADVDDVVKWSEVNKFLSSFICEWKKWTRNDPDSCQRIEFLIWKL